MAKTLPQNRLTHRTLDGRAVCFSADFWRRIVRLDTAVDSPSTARNRGTYGCVAHPAWLSPTDAATLSGFVSSSSGKRAGGVTEDEAAGDANKGQHSPSRKRDLHFLARRRVRQLSAAIPFSTVRIYAASLSRRPLATSAFFTAASYRATSFSCRRRRSASRKCFVGCLCGGPDAILDNGRERKRRGDGV